MIGMKVPVYRTHAQVHSLLGVKFEGRRFITSPTLATHIKYKVEMQVINLLPIRRGLRLDIFSTACITSYGTGPSKA